MARETLRTKKAFLPQKKRRAEKLAERVAELLEDLPTREELVSAGREAERAPSAGARLALKEAYTALGRAAGELGSWGRVRKRAKGGAS